MDKLKQLLNASDMTDVERKQAINQYLSEQLVNTTEAAQLINASRRTIENYVKKESLIPVIHRPHNILFWKSDILQLKKKVSDNKKDPRGWHRKQE
ncbi:hypothetical protein [Listeria booriae]|uniref:hypothetical protein n=1 Tax=Listeria booriae TaxID=1552123 RepID=UPI001E52BA26|nr:hypothetical protein [Listeria booriae]MCD2208576.1 hypothetical protein [Listeria booriae]